MPRAKMLCELCSDLIRAAWSQSTVAQPTDFNFQHGTSQERRKWARSGCKLCNWMHYEVEGIGIRPQITVSARVPGLIYWNGIALEIFDPDPIDPVDLLQTAQWDKDLPRPLWNLPKALPASTDDSETLQLMRYWLQTCLERHSDCREQTEAKLPTRVINIGSNSDKQPPYVMETHGRSGTYVTLSHRWGHPPPLETKLSNLERHKDAVPLADIPPTFKEAFQLLRFLGIRYIWIDSLCIIQDSEMDWATEAAKMAEFYSKSLFTLSATSARSSVDGLFRKSGARSHVLFQCNLGEGLSKHWVFALRKLALTKNWRNHP